VLNEGDLLAGKYRIERRLGEGGMGTVVAAFHEQLQQRVAIKFLSPDHAKNPDAAARFLREARAAVKIQSEHVARVIDVAELESGAPYMVMEYLLGNDLSDELQRVGSLELATAVDYVLQSCEAIAEAHSVGLVHRDLKPANLFLTRRADGSPLVKVLDFGISKALSAPEESTALTSAKAMLGSPAYMSPEQARTPKLVDQRTDIWALGVIMFEFLAGDIPFTGDNAMALLAAAFIDKTPSLRAIRPDIPREMEAVIERCLQKNPADRYQSIADFAEALAPFAERASLPSVIRIQGTIARPVSSIPPPMSVVGGGVSDRRAQADTQLATKLSSAPSEATAETLMDWGKSKDQPRRSRTVALVGGAAGLIALGVLAWQVMSRPTAAPAAKGEAAAEPAARAPVVGVIPAAGPGARVLPKTPMPEVTPSTELPPVPSASVPPRETRRPSVPSKATKAAPAAEADPLDGRR
jgi:serine/threonine-protein kinase